MRTDTKLTQKQRAAQVVALATAGMTQVEIAKEMNISRSTVVRDLEDLRPSVEQASAIIDRAQARLREVLPVEKRIDEYVSMLDVAKVTKQPSAGAAILQRLDDIDGLKTAKDLDRAKSNEQQQSQPMFMLPPGTSVNVTVNTTTSSKDEHHNSASGHVIDVTSTNETTPSTT